MRRFALLILLLTGCLAGQLFAPTRAAACSCVRSLRPVTVTPLSALSDAGAVFSGRVVYAGSPLLQLFGPDHYDIRFVVSTVWKGTLSADYTVTTPTGCCACGALNAFDIGQDYLVYAGSNGGPGSVVSICDRILALPQAGPDLAALGPGYAPTASAPFEWGWLVIGFIVLLGIIMIIWRRWVRPVPE